MVKDAEANAEEDKALERTGRRTQPGRRAGALHEEGLTEYGDKLDAGEKEKIEAAMKDLEDSAEKRRTTRPRSTPRSTALSTRVAEAGEKMYADMQAAARRGSGCCRWRRARRVHRNRQARASSTTTWSMPTSRKSRRTKS